MPGESGAIQLHAHQKAGVWRILQTPNTLLAHVVGAGKTYTMVAAAMESRRWGLSGKPMLVVANHMLGQFSTELLTLTDTAQGTIRSLEANVQGFEERASKLECDIAAATKRGKEWETKVGAHFEREERYQELTRGQGEIKEKLDLTKNQTPSQADAAISAEREDYSRKQTEAKALQKIRRIAIRL